MLRKWEQIQHNISSPYLEENYNFLRHEQNDENFCVDYYDDETRKGKCFQYSMMTRRYAYILPIILLLKVYLWMN